MSGHWNRRVTRARKTKILIPGWEQESYRGKLLTYAAEIEMGTKSALSRVFLEKGRNDLFKGPTSPLSNQHGRLLLALSIGLIDDDECKFLNDTRRVRNHYAHVPHPSLNSFVTDIRYKPIGAHADRIIDIVRHSPEADAIDNESAILIGFLMGQQFTTEMALRAIFLGNAIKESAERCREMDAEELSRLLGRSSPPS